MADHYQLGQRVRVRWRGNGWPGCCTGRAIPTAEAARTIRASDVSLRARIKTGWG
ncbi:MAG: hypothetical protein IPL38_07325 [Rhodobacter sp.]|nr:hypothetical protein [Rhodobacter sp.]